MGDAGGSNVRVAVRARPLSGSEKEKKCSECITFKDGKVAIIKDAAGKEKVFAFDFCYGIDSTQQQVYTDLALPIVEGAIDGFNGVIFAYGQTGSGKTHSMIGSGEDIGIVPLMNGELFSLLQAKKEKEGIDFLVTAAYMEIYNEIVRDLLNPSEKQLKIREHPQKGVYVENLAEIVVDSAKAIEALLDQGNAVKQVASTQMNHRSSRSHCCFIVCIEQRKVEEIGNGANAAKRETSLSAKINLVDLAGSERASKTGAQGDRLKEGAAINQSLSTLGLVINMLAEGSTAHIPYRNSKLTRVLQQALGGNANTVMIAAVSPADYNYHESLSTMQYAARASKITNQATRNEDVSEKMIRELQEEVERLRSEMEAMNRVGKIAVVEEVVDMDEMQKKIDQLEETKAKQWEEIERMSKVFEAERDATLQNEVKVRNLMQNVKDEKIILLKRIHEIEKENEAFNKNLKVAKHSYQATKSKLENDMALYQKLLDECEGDPTPEMESLISHIEENRMILTKCRMEIKNTKAKIVENEQTQIDLKAELEAQKLVLEEDADLRRAIQDEERMKFEESIAGMKDDIIEKQMIVEKHNMKLSLESQMKFLSDKYERKLSYLEARITDVNLENRSLNIRFIESESKNLFLKKEVLRLQREVGQCHKSHIDQVAEIKGNHDNLVYDLVDGFKKEYAKVLKALKIASADCVKLLLDR